LVAGLFLAIIKKPAVFNFIKTEMLMIPRRRFIQQSGFALATLLLHDKFSFGKTKPLLSFSTLGCPDWTFPEIIAAARQYGYSGIEVRGIQRELDLVKCKEFNSPESIKSTVDLMKKNRLHFVGLGSSANMHLPPGDERNKNLEEAKKFITLAGQISCPYVRVFPNRFPKEHDKAATIKWIAEGLLELGDYAKEKNVSVLMETHGDVVKTEDLVAIMEMAKHPNVGLVWDITNMWIVTRESPVDVCNRLHPYIRHTHIKDAVIENGKPVYKFIGKGEVPLEPAIQALMTTGYKGYFSFEWEKLWHPEIAEPAEAFADYPRSVQPYFRAGA
jgi:sugar phosphate isomerase/epimerase